MSNFKHPSKTKKKRICVSVDELSLVKAKSKNLNISKICQTALELAVKGKLVEPK